VFEGSAICGNCNTAVRGTVPVIVEALKSAGRNEDTEALRMKKQSLDALRAPDKVAESIIQKEYRRLEQDITDNSGLLTAVNPANNNDISTQE
jgi:hypothetical protein